MSNRAFAQLIGGFVKHHRLQQNKSQEDLSQAAGISRSTLSLLERGEPVTVPTLIQVLRMLDQLHVLSVFEVPKIISPIALAEAERRMRRRARSKKNKNQSGSEWPE